MDARLGLRIGGMVLLSGGANEILKLALHGPRPYWFSPQVNAYAAETSFGAPSAHAQSAVVLWGGMAAWIKRRWFWLLAILIMFLIGLSRLFLAVHFPHDVLVGWAIGTLLIWVFLKCLEPAAAWVAGRSLVQQLGLAFSLSMLILVFGSIAYGALSTWVMPTEWLANTRQAGVDLLPAPVSLDNTISFSAPLFGLLVGVAWTNSRGGFSAIGTTRQKVLRLLPGLIGILVLYLGLAKIIPPGQALLPFLMRYIRYALVCLWITGGAPWLFQKLNLVQEINI